MKFRKDNCYVITGDSGVGVPTLLNELENYDYQVIPENAKSIFKQEMENNGDGLPWKNKKRYTQS